MPSQTWRLKNPEKARAQRQRELENRRKRKLSELFGVIDKSNNPQQPRTDLSGMGKEERRLHRNARVRRREKLGPVFGRPRRTKLTGMTPEELRQHNSRLKVARNKRRYHNGGQDAQLEASRRWRRKYPEKIATIQRRTLLKRKYGLTLEQYEEMRLAQNDCCAICKAPRTSTSQRFKHWAVDHDKKTRKVRKLLCHNCNGGLGYFDHDPEILERAAQYMRDHAGPE